MRDVKALVKSLNVQLDNLCQVGFTTRKTSAQKKCSFATYPEIWDDMDIELIAVCRKNKVLPVDTFRETVEPR
jgi:hypothetical protein